jgi:hypothetical protein
LAQCAFQPAGSKIHQSSCSTTTKALPPFSPIISLSTPAACLEAATCREWGGCRQGPPRWGTWPATATTLELDRRSSTGEAASPEATPPEADRRRRRKAISRRGTRREMTGRRHECRRESKSLNCCCAMASSIA